MNASLADAVLASPKPPDSATAPLASVQSCDLSCRFARPLADALYAEQWLWCTRPGRLHRLTHIGPDCPRYQPTIHRFDHTD